MAIIPAQRAQLVGLSYNDEAARRLLSEMARRGRSWEPAARVMHREMIVRTDSMFARLRQGGTHRGQTWRYFAPQYTRKTDGVTVPAWGGVPKVRGTGTVLGRLRPSGQRIAAGDAVGQDTGHLRRSALQALRLSKSRMVMGTNPTYASQFQRLRAFAFFQLTEDLTMMRQTLLRYFQTGKP